MARSGKTIDPIDQQIIDAHRRYVEVMEQIRLESISTETKEKYLQVVRSVTEKLALPSKPLSEVVSELMAEAAPFLFQTMQSK